METSKDFEEFFVLLNHHNVAYLVVGGYAYAVHAEPRYTKDLDIFYGNSDENVEKILKAIADFGFQSLDISLDDLTTSGTMVQLGFPPFRIDLLNDIEEVNFQDAQKNGIETRYGDEIINVIGLDDLITNKEASGREQDLVDVKRLKKEL